MTGLEGNRQIYLPLEIQDNLPKSFYKIFGEAILNLGQIDKKGQIAYYLRDQSEFVLLYQYVKRTLKEKKFFFNLKLIKSTIVLISLDCITTSCF